MYILVEFCFVALLLLSIPVLNFDTLLLSCLDFTCTVEPSALLELILIEILL